MAYRVFPDTNIVSALFDDDAVVVEKFNSADEILVAVIVLGELFFGAEKSARRDMNMAKYDAFAAKYSVLDCTMETAKHYAVIRNALRIKGRPIPDNDIWIAALAIQHDLTLITRDAHFAEVEGLRSEKW